MSATATEPKSRPLFTVKGGASGIVTNLSKTAEDALARAADVLNCLAQAGPTFPKANDLANQLTTFLANPTQAKP